MPDSTEPADEELMALTAKGDDDAFTLLVRRHQNMVYGTVAKMLGGAGAEAEDVAQQIFIRVYKAAPRYQPTAKFTTWLLTICRNMVFTHCKQRQRWRHEPLEHEDEEGNPIESTHADTRTPSSPDSVLQNELEQAVNRALNNLPEKQRLAMILRQYEQLDYEQIAKVLETSVPSVKSLLFRARETMRAELEKYLSNPQ